MNKTMVAGLILTIASVSFGTEPTEPYEQDPRLRWRNVCATADSSDVSYCKDVGKDAYNATGAPAMRNVKLGRIVGVCWRPEGSIIGISPAIPAAGIPEQVRTSPRNAYYYIIDDGSRDYQGQSKPFLRMCREITPRTP